MAARLGWLILVFGIVGRSTAEGNAFFPAQVGMRLTYVTSNSKEPDKSLRWELSFRRTDSLAPDAERITLRALVNRLETNGQPLTREEHYAAGQQGVFTFDPDSAEERYGPTPLLPGPEQLNRVDTVWRYRGFRPRPLALGLFGLLGAPETPVPTEGHYHVLAVAPLTTKAGTFKGAVQVTGIESFDVALDAEHSLNMLLRCRRWYVRGVGLVREQFEFLDFPVLGLTTTDLVAYTGVAELPGEPQHMAGAPDNKAG